MSTITLSFFGTPTIEQNGVPVRIGRRKALALLAYLAVTAQPHARDVLAALLWPDKGQPRARANLRHMLHELNGALGPEWIACEGDLVVVHPQRNLQVDVSKFVHAAAAPSAHEHPLPHLCDACIRSLQWAAELYIGDFLAGFSLPDAPEFEAWEMMHRESLQRQLASLLDQLALAYAGAERRQFDHAIAFARRRLALDPLHEPAHRRLMQLYLESGDRGSALRQYEECARILEEELHVPPEAETTELANQIRRGIVSFQEEETPAVERPVHNLPSETTSFIGRTRELRQVAARLANKQCRLLSIVGPGGSGKTRLAIQTASAERRHFRDGVYFCDLSQVASPDLLATTILRCLNAPESGAADPRRRLGQYLGPKQTLIVLDNMEHLLESVTLLSDLLREAPDLKFLVTSRERLNILEEWLEPLEGLDVPPCSPSEMTGSALQPRPQLEAYDATRLFLDRMRRLRPDFETDIGVLSDQDVAAIADICCLLEGMPLAIEFAAGWTHTLSLYEVREEIGRGLDLMRTTLRDLPPRLRSMRATFDYSWQLLSDGERNIMRGMSVFRGGCTRQAAEQVTGATISDLAGLVDKCWIQLRRDGRYSIHELARQYCEEKLTALEADSDKDPCGELNRRHCAYYGFRVKSLISTVNHEPAALDNIMAELDNLVAALKTAVHNVDTDIAYDMIMAVFFVGDMMGWLRFSLETLEIAGRDLQEQLADSSLSQVQRADVARVLAGIFHAQYSQFRQLGALREASKHDNQLQALVASMQPGRAQYYWESWLRLNHASLNAERGNFDKASALAQRALDEFMPEQYVCYLFDWPRGVALWECEGYSKLAQFAFARGDYRTSEENFARSMKIRDRAGEQRKKGMDLAHYAHLKQTMGYYAQAEDLALQGLRLSKACGDRMGMAMGHLATGRVLAVQGRHRSAFPHLCKCLEAGRRSGRLELTMQSLCLLGRIDLAAERLENALDRFEAADAAFVEAGVDHSNALCGVWLGRGWYFLAADNASEAVHMFERAGSAVGAKAYEIQESKVGQALARLGRGEISEAKALLHAVIAHPATAHDSRRLAQHRLAELHGGSDGCYADRSHVPGAAEMP